MFSAIRAAAILLAAALLFGCSVDLEKAVVGRYRAEVDLSGVSEKMKTEAERAATMLSGVSVEVKEDKKVSVSAANMTMDGTWKIEDGQLILEMKDGPNFPPFRIEEAGRILRPAFSEEETSRMAGARIWLKRE